MSGWSIMLDVLILLAAALAVGAVSERLHQSAIVGYLLAGMLLGPNALGWVHQEDRVEVLADLGVALLLFSIGLEFSWRRLRQLGPRALVSGVLQVTATLLITAGIAIIFGASVPTAIAVGAMIAPSSTACVLRVLHHRAELDSMHGRFALGILLLQDIAVVPLILLVEMLGDDGTIAEVAGRAAIRIGGAVALVATFAVVFNLIVPRLMGSRVISRNRELPILLALVTVLGSAIAAHRADLSPALGAFVAGMLLGGTPFAVQIRADIGSVRTLLLTLFFTTVGMLAKPSWMLDNWGAVVGLVAAVILGKALIVAGVLRFVNRRYVHAVATGLCLAQVGEFAFVLAGIARGSLIDDHLFNLVISAAIVTLILTPYLVSTAPRLGGLVQTILSRGSWRPPPKESEVLPDRGSILIVGFGPAGRAVADAVTDRRQMVHVIDLNPQVKNIAEGLGLIGHVGDATQADVLAHAALATAETVVITLPDPATAARVIEHIRATKPGVQIVARSRYHVRVRDIQDAGADIVVDEEEEVGRRLAEEVLAGKVQRGA